MSLFAIQRLATTWFWTAEWMTDMEGMQKKAEKVVEDPSNELWSPLVDKVLIPLGQITLIILLAYIALRYVDRVIDRLLNISRFHQKKGATLNRLIKSTARYAICFIAIIAVLEKLDVPVTSILAGAGIVGLAVGFGAQNLVKDVISGFFIIFDNQMDLGDYVQINGNIEGTVEEIGLRVTKIREFSQRLHYVSNGEITRVTNYNRDRMRPLVGVTVPYEADQELVQRTLHDINEDLSRRLAPYVIEPFSLFGVTNIQHDGVEYTIMGVVTPEEYWMVEREMRKTIVRVFHEKGIEIAYPRQILVPSQDLRPIFPVVPQNEKKPEEQKRKEIETEPSREKGDVPEGEDG
ncbi:small conductance mechanosensitive channel [Melghirimyces profundicolus]|uniref:Small conductance mechanosensitive channel n=1 Tax=Melghirimyces profundicolus TaxID=1242148 RepID=A0A2T6BXE0_9BACL|nr:mechanosensitive ion channel family protein [Melghirimyces profundicolus]PTX60751.1 small conductance mechanosensitive channel [Melghirimyces profundicolus]